MPFGMDPDDMPGGGPGRGRGGGGGPVDNEEYYKVLGVEKTATADEIRKAYRKACVRGPARHPDKGGDPEKFKQLGEAFGVLSDPEKREKYDRYGKEGLEEGGGGGGDADDIFSAMFGGGGRRGRQGPKKGEDHVHPLKVSLEDLYKGRTVKLAITRNVICEDCDGRGGKEGADVTCTDCRGRGIKVMMRQVGPGMIQQSQVLCPTCRGAKTTMREEDKCSGCSGERTVRGRKVLEVYIERGMKAGDKITFTGEADQQPGGTPGDVVFVVEEKPHAVFTRKGPDLFMSRTLTLSEALTGFSFPVTRPDGKVLMITNTPGQIVKPASLMAVDNEGMPIRGAGEYTRGHLFVQFKVEFPKPSDLSRHQTVALKRTLPPKPDVVFDDEMEHVTLRDDLDASTPTPWAMGGSEAYESDDEEGGGGQRVQCASQ